MPISELTIPIRIKGLWAWKLYVSFLIALSQIFPEYILSREMLYRSAIGFANRHLKICVGKKENPVGLKG